MKSVRLLVITLFLFFLIVQNAQAATKKKSDKPNIVFILADDLGYGDLGCYGHPYAKTAAIDSLAAEGTLFKEFYASGITSSPSRTGFMTGRYPARFKKLPKDYGFSDAETVTELLHRNGYKTGHFGKWHIGPESKSGTYGIDKIVVDEIVDRSDPRGRDASIFDKAIDFIEKNQKKPFYINIWTYSTHHPIGAQQGLKNNFEGLEVDVNLFSDYMQTKLQETKLLFGKISPGMQLYMSEVFALDQQVQRILEKLDGLGLSKNTIVVFSSDQGAVGSTNLTPKSLEELKGEISKKGKLKFKKEELSLDDPEVQLYGNLLGYNGPLRGGKHDQYEGGVRIPFIIRWPGVIPAGKVNKSVIGAVDWLPTLSSLTGTVYHEHSIDGYDVSDIWMGSEKERTTPLFWKVSRKGGIASLRSGDWKYHAKRKQHVGELYNLKTDVGEKNNVAADNPQLVSELRTLLKNWVESLPEENGEKN